MSQAMVLALTVFLLTYALIISEKMHRAVAALLGGMFLIVAGVLSQEKAVGHVDWNTLGLLIGMMIIVGITRMSGVFQYLAIKAAKKAKGEPVYILVALATVTAVLSAFLDNVTTVLLLVPVTFTIADMLGVDPIPFLISQVLASNIGGTATLIGDPPNIMIGSQAHLGFVDFLVNLTPVVVVIHLVTMAVFFLLYRRKLTATPDLKQKIMNLDERQAIKDYALLRKSLLVLGLVMAGFLLHQFLHLESATIALFGAALLMLITKVEPEEIFLAVEWPSLFFFLGLFIVVGGLVETGIIDRVARWSLQATAGNFTLTGMLILWLSALTSAFVDNIPFVATMIPLIHKMGALAHMTPEALNPLWWSLSLGACLGGNGTLIGASANVIVAGIAEKEGYPLSYRRYFVYGFPLMLLTILVSMAYLLLFYF